MDQHQPNVAKSKSAQELLLQERASRFSARVISRLAWIDETVEAVRLARISFKKQNDSTRAIKISN